ncbi:PAS domain S-box protein [Natrarchaeobius chitinivorans]|uniref:histidine kinase n=1 Tax=Natrarchaeobius chitinivorans TaxID=1679083 RepID=A0A3N6LZR1_NATCH|nr:PAS domain S-box protein [Natrarchaeobius chitinivorans]RQG93444.1 PAS domain S-box protein [Natrarchaeobius chitinivorans]
MTRPRVLCVSTDRATRASVTLSLTDAPVDVVIAQHPSEAVSHLENADAIDAVLVDASTVENVPDVVDAVDSEAPGVPTFVHWSAESGPRNDSVAVLSEVFARAEDADPSARLADVVTAQIDADGTTDDGRSARDGTDLDRIVDESRRRLVDVRSPLTVERILRESITSSDRFLFVWVGEYDRREREIVPWLTPSTGSEWPLRRTFAIGTGKHPMLDRLIRSRDLQVHQPLESDPEDVPFGELALGRGVDAVAAVPLGTPEELYGVLVVYGLEPFSSPGRDAIQSVADAASYVLETIAVHGRLEQCERALQRYERLVETAGDGMYVLDDQGHFMTVNDALVEMTGYSREGLLGEHASILVEGPGVEAGETTIESLLRAEGGRTTDTIELSFETKAGKTIPCEVQVSVLVRNGTFLGSVGVVRDITERKRRERKLQQRNERLDAFARIVSHDLRNPLSVSQGYLDVIEETGSLEHVENVRGGLDRMESIIEDVLAIARGGEWAAETESVDVESVAESAWGHVSTGDGTLSVPGSMTIEADRERLLRLLENLFRNAIEHGVDGSGEAISVRIGPLDGDESGFFVEDDGRGIPRDVREDLFDPAVSSSSDGLGIGLWIVREVATGHGWSVTATESENGGARFEFGFADQFSG